MSEAADEIAGFAKAIEESKPTAPAMSELLTLPFGAAISEPKNLTVSGVKIERIAPAAEAPQAAPVLAIAGLPETGYERLVGRDTELKRLDEAWSDGQTAILSLIAEGGAGKSALVNEWLKRLRADAYRGADCVLGWSFYSQGSKERATAADEFLNWALAQLGVKLQTTSASAKGEAIAEALASRRVLLVLDGVEPLQHGPGPQAGQLKDQGLRALLRRFAAAPPKADHSLIVLTSRIAVADIRRFKDDAAPVIDVERLSDEAGAELLRDNYVWGIDKELRAASREFGGHPLALTLLASLIKETQTGDVRRRDHIRLLGDDDDPLHGHARRVMDSYEKEWLAGQPVLLAILHCVGLFDRPASGDCLKALRAKPAVAGLTDALVDLGDEPWLRHVERLRDVRLLAPRDPSDPEAIDAHPLVREWFGERLKATNEAAWKAGHSRLYDHLRDTTKEGKTPTLADLAPLYHALRHGCRAGRQQEALVEVYIGRLCRQRPDGQLEFYSNKTLGAVASNLAAIAGFFERPYEAPSAALVGPACSFVLSQASVGLRAQGRLREALQAMHVSARMSEEAQAWRDAAADASSLIQTEQLAGDVKAALAAASIGTAHADRSGAPGLMLFLRADNADALHAAGELEKAAKLFSDAERRQQQLQPKYPLLYALAGFQYCDLLQSQRSVLAVLRRARQTLEWARPEKKLLPIARDTLTLGRANLAVALQSLAGGASAASARAGAHASAESLDTAVEGLRASGHNDELPRGLIARAAFRRAVGNWDGAARDLDEAHEFAEPGPMRLFLCDVALERARLALARNEAFAPLSGLVGAHPPPVFPDAAVAAALREVARKQLDVARELIADCGYHRRDEELAELDTIAAGARRFASLPPRV